MKTILENLEKWIIYVLYIVCIMVIFNTCNSCSRNREQSELKKEIESQRQEIDNLSKRTITVNEMELILDENGLEFLIFEDNLDKNKISLGIIINKLEEKKKERKENDN